MRIVVVLLHLFLISEFGGSLNVRAITDFTKRSLRDFLSLRHPNHFVLAGAGNRNVIITYRFLAAPVQANAKRIYTFYTTTRKISAI